MEQKQLFHLSTIAMYHIMLRQEQKSAIPPKTQGYAQKNSTERSSSMQSGQTLLLQRINVVGEVCLAATCAETMRRAASPDNETNKRQHPSLRVLFSWKQRLLMTPTSGLPGCRIATNREMLKGWVVKIPSLLLNFYAVLHNLLVECWHYCPRKQ